MAKLKEIYEQIIQGQKLSRIAVSLMGYLSKERIHTKLNKLPKNKKYLDEITESVDKFRIRRVQAFCDKLVKENKYETRSQVLIDNSIKDVKLTEKMKNRINLIIEKYHNSLVEEI